MLNENRLVLLQPPVKTETAHCVSFLVCLACEFFTMSSRSCFSIPANLLLLLLCSPLASFFSAFIESMAFSNSSKPKAANKLKFSLMRYLIFLGMGLCPLLQSSLRASSLVDSANMTACSQASYNVTGIMENSLAHEYEN